MSAMLASIALAVLASATPISFGEKDVVDDDVHPMENPTTDGVRRLPSWFAITVGLPPSTTETTEFVVPRSMPITLGITVCSIPWAVGPAH